MNLMLSFLKFCFVILIPWLSDFFMKSFLPEHVKIPFLGFCFYLKCVCVYVCVETVESILYIFFDLKCECGNCA